MFAEKYWPVPFFPTPFWGKVGAAVAAAELILEVPVKYQAVVKVPAIYASVLRTSVDYEGVIVVETGAG